MKKSFKIIIILGISIFSNVFFACTKETNIDLIENTDVDNNVETSGRASAGFQYKLRATVTIARTSEVTGLWVHCGAGVGKKPIPGSSAYFRPSFTIPCPIVAKDYWKGSPSSYLPEKSLTGGAPAYTPVLIDGGVCTTINKEPANPVSGQDIRISNGGNVLTITLETYNALNGKKGDTKVIELAGPALGAKSNEVVNYKPMWLEFQSWDGKFVD